MVYSNQLLYSYSENELSESVFNHLHHDQSDEVRKCHHPHNNAYFAKSEIEPFFKFNIKII